MRRLLTPTLLLALALALVAPSAEGATRSGYRDDTLRKARLWVDPWSPARHAADERRASDPAAAAALDKVAGQPTAQWFGDWNSVGTVRATVAQRASLARRAGAIPVVVLYAIPHRDCTDGAGLDASTYRAWIREVDAGLGAGSAAVVLEPDALGLLSCLDATRQAERTRLLAEAVRVLRQNKRGIYLDASSWVPPTTMAARLRAAGVRRARGFSLNVSNYRHTHEQLVYGRSVRRLSGARAFVVDVSRNGLGPAPGDPWCNAAGRALGRTPTTAPRLYGVDALLWIKPPGESDGSCRPGEPAAGVFWPDYAVGLAERAAW